MARIEIRGPDGRIRKQSEWDLHRWADRGFERVDGRAMPPSRGAERALVVAEHAKENAGELRRRCRAHRLDHRPDADENALALLLVRTGYLPDMDYTDPPGDIRG